MGARRYWPLLAALGWVSAATADDIEAGQEAATRREAGQEVATRWCARCHVVGTANPYGGIGSSPSFFLMQERLDDYRQRIWTFQERRPHKAQTFDVERADIEHLIAYIGSLERP
jgi:mono/diheme cytochrome c family protein